MSVMPSSLVVSVTQFAVVVSDESHACVGSPTSHPFGRSRRRRAASRRCWRWASGRRDRLGARVVRGDVDAVLCEVVEEEVRSPGACEVVERPLTIVHSGEVAALVSVEQVLDLARQRAHLRAQRVCSAAPTPWRRPSPVPCRSQLMPSSSCQAQPKLVQGIRPVAPVLHVPGVCRPRRRERRKSRPSSSGRCRRRVSASACPRCRRG